MHAAAQQGALVQLEDTSQQQLDATKRKVEELVADRRNHPADKLRFAREDGGKHPLPPYLYLLNRLDYSFNITCPHCDVAVFETVSQKNSFAVSFLVVEKNQVENAQLAISSNCG